MERSSNYERTGSWGAAPALVAAVPDCVSDLVPSAYLTRGRAVLERFAR